MKRLVVCCDGTWNEPASDNVTNIEKIARTISTDPDQCDQVQQLVLYVGGVGIGYKLDRLLGGAFGSGLFNNVKTAYRFLALNYEEGDEIFAFGFSRGAYTARSLVGMIGFIGLLTRESLVANKLPEAVDRYQRKEPKNGGFGSSNDEFKRDFCHPKTPTKFLGVFDTVGALGVPGLLPKDHQFHDINLGDSVECARQALAIDEDRMVFAPCLWNAPTRPERVRQVWFEGAHSDVGGGYAADRPVGHGSALDGQRGEPAGTRLRQAAARHVRQLQVRGRAAQLPQVVLPHLQSPRTDPAATRQRAGAVHRRPPQPRRSRERRDAGLVRTWALRG